MESDSDEEVKGPARQKPQLPQYSVDIDSLPTIAMEEVKKHKSKEDCWTVVDGLVYDVTHYIP